MYNLLQEIDALLIPLDKPTVDAFIPLDDEEGPAKKQWVGGTEEWVAFVQHPGRWCLQNVYRNVDFDLPAVERVDINPIVDYWERGIPLTYEYKRARIQLPKIEITSRPIMRGRDGKEEWHYSAIAVFDKLIAIIKHPRDIDWIILRHDYLAPAKYVDTIDALQWGV